MMDGQGKSDRLIVPKKATNKAGELAAEALEGRGLAKGNPNQRDTDRTQGRERVSSALERVRQAGNRSASDSRQEPGAVVPHAGIRGGGAPQGASLLRPPCHVDLCEFIRCGGPVGSPSTSNATRSRLRP